MVALAVLLQLLAIVGLGCDTARARQQRQQQRQQHEQQQGQQGQRQPPVAYDVVVYGATSGGVMAAVAAARRGARVALLDPATRIGGMSAGGLSSTDKGNPEVIGGMALDFYKCNGRHYDMSGPEFMLEPHVALAHFHKLVVGANVSLFHDAAVASVAMTGPRLTSLRTVDGRTFAASVFIEADYEADLLARAGVSYSLGREGVSKYNESLNGYRLANEGHEFSIAVDPFVSASTSATLPMVSRFDPAQSVPGQADAKVQAYNFRLCVTTDPTNKVPFPKPAGYDPAYWELARRYFTDPRIVPCVRAPSGNVAGCRKDSAGVYQSAGSDAGTADVDEHLKKDHRGADLNNGGPISTDFVGASWKYPEANYTERAAIVEAHKQYTRGFLWFMSTDPALNQSIRKSFQEFGLCADEFQETENWPPALYVRAARRLVGESVFTQNTPETHRNWANQSIGCGSYNFDSHTAERLACPNATMCGTGPKGAKMSQAFAWMEGDVETGPGVYDIPLWVLLPKRNEASNLLVVASPSASHIGMSTLRMEPQFMIMGQSAGVIAALSLSNMSKTGATLHDIDIDTMHAALLKDGQKMNEACHIAPPPAPPGPHAAEYTVSGAGTSSCNGVYKYDPGDHRDTGTPFYKKDNTHQIYRSGGVWRLASGLSKTPFLYYTAEGRDMSPPSSGWVIDQPGQGHGEGMPPVPTLVSTEITQAAATLWYTMPTSLDLRTAARDNSTGAKQDTTGCSIWRLTPPDTSLQDITGWSAGKWTGLSLPSPVPAGDQIGVNPSMLGSSCLQWHNGTFGANLNLFDDQIISGGLATLTVDYTASQPNWIYPWKSPDSVIRVAFEYQVPDTATKHLDKAIYSTLSYGLHQMNCSACPEYVWELEEAVFVDTISKQGIVHGSLGMSERYHTKAPASADSTNKTWVGWRHFEWTVSGTQVQAGLDDINSRFNFSLSTDVSQWALGHFNLELESNGAAKAGHSVRGLTISVEESL